MNEETPEPVGDDPIERELSERLARGDDAPVQDTDPAPLRQASAWIEHLDALVTEVEHRATPAEGPAPDPATVRDLVLARLAGGRAVSGAAPSRRSPAPRRPWWQTAAPFAVASALAALFFWQQQGEPGDPLPSTPTAIDARQVLPEPRPLAAPAAKEQAVSGGVAESDAGPAPSTLEAAPLARTLVPAPVRPAHAEAESLLTELGRSPEDPDRNSQVRARLLILRAAIADTALVARIDQSLARLPPDPR